MSRALRFRAWDKKRKRYAKVIQTTNQGWKGYRDKTYITNGIMLFSKWVLRRFIIEQYTGIEDKSGKEIYEGDIVKIWSDEMSELALGGSQYHLEHYPYTREVKMDSRGVYIEHPGYMLLRNFADLEVIGNIHESNMEELCQKEKK